MAQKSFKIKAFIGFLFAKGRNHRETEAVSFRKKGISYMFVVKCYASLVRCTLKNAPFICFLQMLRRAAATYGS